MAATGVMLLTDAAKPGLVDAATPAMLFGGGLGLLFIGVLLFFASKKMGRGSDGSDFMETAGWIFGVLGVVGVAIGLFGEN